MTPPATASVTQEVIDLYAISRFLGTGLWTDGSLPVDALASALVLSDAGRMRIREIPEVVAEPDLVVGALLAFYGEEELIDSSAVDIDKVVEIVSSLLRDELVRLPYVFGTTLQEVYRQQFDRYLKDLDADQSLSLLKGVPQGVFQIGSLVTGPFGLLRSCALRLFPPTSTGPSVSCADPGCEAIHAVQLAGQDHAIHDVEHLLDELVVGPWATTGADVQKACGTGDGYMDDENPATLPLLIANGFRGEELRQLFISALAADGSTRRHWPSGLKGSAQDVAAGLGDAALLQLLLLHSNDTLVAAIEVCIDERRIVIPPGEVRTPVLGAQSLDGGFYDVQSEVSQHGVRFRSRRRNLATLKLIRLLRTIYSGEADQGQLGWALKRVPGESPTDKLRHAAHSEPPRELLERLVLVSPERTEAATRFLRIEWDLAVGDDSRLLDRMLWRLGFSVRSTGGLMPQFWDRLGTFKAQVSASVEPYGEPDKEGLRSVGVNLFVALEEVLDHALAYTSWALLTDHYRVDRMRRFRFNLAAARDVMAGALDQVSVNGGPPLTVTADGSNTLYPLIHGFGALAQIVAATVEGDRTGLVHRPEDLPDWLQDQELFSFPFRHKQVMLDIRPEALEVIRQRLDAFPRAMDAAEVAAVRNGLGHNREAFPTKAKILSALDGMSDAVRGLELAGICPSPYEFRGQVVDEYRRAVATLADYRGHEINLPVVHELSHVGLPGVNQEQLVFHEAKLADSGGCLRFDLEPLSDHADRWRGFEVKRVAESAPDTGTASLAVVPDLDPVPPAE